MNVQRIRVEEDGRLLVTRDGIPERVSGVGEGTYDRTEATRSE